MITFTQVSQATFNGIQFVIQGDGSSTVLKVNLAKPPFGMNFDGNVPAGFTIDLGGADLGEATAAIESTTAGDILSITFTQPPPSTETVGINLAPFYASLA